MTDDRRKQPDVDVQIVAVPHDSGPEGPGHDWHDLQQQFKADERTFSEELQALMGRLRKERKRRGLTQKAVAERMNVSQSRVSAIESGNFEATEIRTLTKYLSAIGYRLRLSTDIGT